MTGREFDFETELDDMHRAVLSVLPEKLLDLTDIAVTRAGLDALMEQMPSAEIPSNISVEDVHVPGIDGDPDVFVRVYNQHHFRLMLLACYGYMAVGWCSVLLTWMMVSALTWQSNINVS